MGKAGRGVYRYRFSGLVPGANSQRIAPADRPDPGQRRSLAAAARCGQVDVRVALLKNFNLEADVTYRDYKKFRTDTRIVPVGELQEQH